MRVAIRYQSRGGHVREMAEIIAEGAEVEPISIDDERAPITEPVDLLFIGGALYKFKLDPGMEDYLASIPADLVRTATVFGSSALTRRPLYIIQERLKARGITINPSAMYMRGKPKPYLHEIGPGWARGEVKKIERQIEEGTVGKAPEAPIVTMLNEANRKREAAAEAAKELVAQAQGTDADEVERAFAERESALAEQAVRLESALDEKAAAIAAEGDALAEKGAEVLERVRAKDGGDKE